MPIRKGDEKDFEKLAAFYGVFFRVHNILKKPRKEVVKSLKEQKGELIVCEEGGSINGALFMVNSSQSPDGIHRLWKLRHFAFESERVASELLDEAEKMVMVSSNTSKIEIYFAESEKGMDFLISKGYRQEAALSNHYRWGEICYVLSKSFRN